MDEPYLVIRAFWRLLITSLAPDSVKHRAISHKRAAGGIIVAARAENLLECQFWDIFLLQAIKAGDQLIDFKSIIGQRYDEALTISELSKCQKTSGYQKRSLIGDAFAIGGGNWSDIIGARDFIE